MLIDLGSAQDYMRHHALDAWLLYDFEQSNPIFWEIVGPSAYVTRPCTLFVPADGSPTLLVHQVDAGKFAGFGTQLVPYLGRVDMQRHLGNILHMGQNVAMEYSPLAILPMLSRVDAGTIELVHSLGVTVVSSAEIIQHAIGLLSEEQIVSQTAAARKLESIVLEAFEYIGSHILSGISEYEVCEFIRQRFTQESLSTDGGPIVAVNEHSGDPHYDPPSSGGAIIRHGDWILIDLWAKETHEHGIYGDLTWVAFAGPIFPEEQHTVFGVVAGARDLALGMMREAFQRGETLEGWQVDEAARDFIVGQGYGPHFTHRLGHSLGKIVHGYAVNLDSFETNDTRPIEPGVALTIEPGVYLPAFGVRSEIDVIMTRSGPIVTSAVQQAIVQIPIPEH